jgi:adenosylhomocysteine nucleosidase
MRIAIIAAMAGELKPLARGWLHERLDGVDLWRWKFDEGEWVAACAGAGMDAATRAFAAAEKDGPLTSVISVGWVGALTEALEAGKAYSVSGVIDVRTGERFGTELGHQIENEKQKQVLRLAALAQDDKPLLSPEADERMATHQGLLLVTGARVADEVEKRRLAAAYGAHLVDMEASAIARLAAMRGIPFYAIKGISDGFTDKLPDFNRFIRTDGRFDVAGMVLFSILRPWHWPSLVRMGENSRKASQSIREAVLDFLDERSTIRERDGYPNLKH